VQDGRIRPKSVLQPYPSKLMRGYCIGPAIGNGRNDRPERIVPIAV
jgi:hypothetical protein